MALRVSSRDLTRARKNRAAGEEEVKGTREYVEALAAFAKAEVRESSYMNNRSVIHRLLVTLDQRLRGVGDDREREPPSGDYYVTQMREAFDTLIRTTFVEMTKGGGKGSHKHPRTGGLGVRVPIGQVAVPKGGGRCRNGGIAGVP